MAADGASSVKGLSKVLGKLSREASKIANKTDQGLMRAGLFIQAESQIRTPVDTGNLVTGARTTWEDRPEGIRVVVSYEAFYAVFVHERKAMHSPPPRDWKFMERAITENWNMVLQIIGKEAAV